MPIVIDQVTGEAVEWSDYEFEKRRTELLLQWTDAKHVLDAAKAAEMKLRIETIRFSTDPAKRKGTEWFHLGNGWRMRAGKSTNYNFVKDSQGSKTDRSAIEKALTELDHRHANDKDEDLSERLVRWVPTLSITEYELLSDEDRATIDRVLVTTDGAPTLEIVPPKD